MRQWQRADGNTSASASRLQQRRQKVTAAARCLFVERGFHSTGIAQIAGAAGIPVQQLYRDFGNKEAIIAAIVEDDIGNLFDQTAVRSARCGDSDALRTWLSQLLNSACGSSGRSLLPEIFAEASRNRRIALIFSDLESNVKKAVLAVLVKYAPASASPIYLEETANLVLVMLNGLSTRRVADNATDKPSLVGTFCRIIEDEIARSVVAV